MQLRGHKLIKDYKVKGGTHITIYEEIPKMEPPPLVPVKVEDPFKPPAVREFPIKIELSTAIVAVAGLVISVLTTFFGSSAALALVRPVIIKVIEEFLESRNVHLPLLQALYNSTKH